MYLLLPPFHFFFVFLSRDYTTQSLKFKLSMMAESGLEVKPHSSPEVAPQPDGNMYYTGGGSNEPIVQQSDQPNQSQAKVQDRFRAVYMLSVIAVVSLTMALGVGLAAGLTAKHKSSLSR